MVLFGDGEKKVLHIQLFFFRRSSIYCLTNLLLDFLEAPFGKLAGFKVKVCPDKHNAFVAGLTILLIALKYRLLSRRNKLNCS